MAYEIRISVKKLAEFLLQSGSLDNRFGGIDRASEGARIHRRLQKAGGPSYRAEVFLSQQTERHAFLYRVEGRADGVITDAVGVTVDEIKTTGAPLTMITEDFNRAHWGQAMCYAYFYCLQENLERISVQLTYFQVDTEETGASSGCILLKNWKRFIWIFSINMRNGRPSNGIGHRCATSPSGRWRFPLLHTAPGRGKWRWRSIEPLRQKAGCSVRLRPALGRQFQPCSQPSKRWARGRQNAFSI